VQQVLAGAHGLRAVEQQGIDPALETLLQRLPRAGVGEQAQGACRVRVEPLGGQGIATGARSPMALTTKGLMTAGTGPMRTWNTAKEGTFVARSS
jgi:hypothetical protein